MYFYLLCSSVRPQTSTQKTQIHSVKKLRDMRPPAALKLHAILTCGSDLCGESSTMDKLKSGIIMTRQTNVDSREAGIVPVTNALNCDIELFLTAMNCSSINM